MQYAYLLVHIKMCWFRPRMKMLLFEIEREFLEESVCRDST